MRNIDTIHKENKEIINKKGKLMNISNYAKSVVQ